MRRQKPTAQLNKIRLNANGAVTGRPPLRFLRLYQSLTGKIKLVCWRGKSYESGFNNCSTAVKKLMEECNFHISGRWF